MEALNNDRSHLPLRMVARVLIMKDDHLLLGKKWDAAGNLYYNFPGGGVEEGDSAEETVQKEALEEVGVQVRNIRPLNVHLEAEHPMGSKREHLFRGTDNHYFVADFVRYDTSKLNSEGDEMPVIWVTPFTALRLIKQTDNPFNVIRIQAIHALPK